MHYLTHALVFPFLASPLKPASPSVTLVTPLLSPLSYLDLSPAFNFVSFPHHFSFFRFLTFCIFLYIVLLCFYFLTFYILFTSIILVCLLFIFCHIFFLFPYFFIIVFFLFVIAVFRFLTHLSGLLLFFLLHYLAHCRGLSSIQVSFSVKCSRLCF